MPAYVVVTAGLGLLQCLQLFVISPLIEAMPQPLNCSLSELMIFRNSQLEINEPLASFVLIWILLKFHQSCETAWICMLETPGFWTLGNLKLAQNENENRLLSARCFHSINPFTDA